MKPKPQTVDEYMSSLTPDQRDALETLRKTIRAAAPKAVECIYYGLPAFRLDGKPLVAFGAAKAHGSFYPLSGRTVQAHQDELKGYSTSKGTIRFDTAKPLPAPLVRRLVKTRIREIKTTALAAAGG